MNTYQQIVLLLAALSLPVHGADSFDGKTLTVPKVFVGGTLYSDVQLTVGKVLSVEGGDARNIYDRYNTANNQLIIPSVAVGGNSYTNVTIEVGSVVSVGGISTTLSANFKNTTSLLSVDSALGVAHSTGLIPFDTNGDGVTDLIFTPSTLNIGPDRKAFLVSNAGNNFNLQPDGVWSKVITTGFVKDWTIKDLNSDGVSDLIWIDHGLELPANQGGFQNGLNVALLSQTKGQYSYRTLSDLKAFNHGLTVPNSSAINNSSSLIVADFQARLKQYTIDSKGNFLQSDLSLGNEFGYSNPGAVATVRMKSNSTSVVAASYTRPNPQWDPNGSIIVYSYDGKTVSKMDKFDFPMSWKANNLGAFAIIAADFRGCGCDDFLVLGETVDLNNYKRDVLYYQQVDGKFVEMTDKYLADVRSSKVIFHGKSITYRNHRLHQSALCC